MKLRSAFASLLLVGAMGLPCLAQASGDSTPTEHHHGHHDMAKMLGLTEAQKTQWQDVMKNQQPGKARREALKKILTPEQQTKWEEMRKAQRQEHKDNS
jgi:Spy/CpxP family protein refolding chaperone